MTLNSLAYQVASSFDRDTDQIFIERIKDLILSTRHLFIHRQTDKTGIDDRYIQPYEAKLEEVNASVDLDITSKFKLLKTINKIPYTIRYQSDVPFVFVGSLDRRIVFRNIKSYIMKYARHLRYIGSGIGYFYTNGYIYIHNNTKLDSILIEAIYESLDVTKDPDPTGICYKDDMEFPLAGDMLNDVIKEVTTIIRGTTDAQDKNPVTIRDIN